METTDRCSHVGAAGRHAHKRSLIVTRDSGVAIQAWRWIRKCIRLDSPACPPKPGALARTEKWLFDPERDR